MIIRQSLIKDISVMSNAAVVEEILINALLF